MDTLLLCRFAAVVVKNEGDFPLLTPSPYVCYANPTNTNIREHFAQSKSGAKAVVCRTMRSLFFSASLGLLACLSTTTVTTVNAEVVLSEKIMELAQASAELSAEVYNPEPNCTDCASLTNYIDEPDQALFAEKDGYCYGVFRGTTLTFVDWNQNFDPRSEPVCTSVDSSVCCNTRQGFYDAYHASYYEKIERSLNECAEKCSNPNECVVLAGHSQGGAVAALAAVRMAHLNPYVMTFGEPPTIDYPCQPVTSTRWYRFVNTKDTTIGTVGVTYDVSTHCLFVS